MTLPVPPSAPSAWAMQKSEQLLENELCEITPDPAAQHYLAVALDEVLLTGEVHGHDRGFKNATLIAEAALAESQAVVERLRDALDAAVLAEREACAQVLIDHANDHETVHNKIKMDSDKREIIWGMHEACLDAAAAIRARGDHQKRAATGGGEGT